MHFSLRKHLYLPTTLSKDEKAIHCTFFARYFISYWPPKARTKTLSHISDKIFGCLWPQIQGLHYWLADVSTLPGIASSSMVFCFCFFFSFTPIIIMKRTIEQRLVQMKNRTVMKNRTYYFWYRCAHNIDMRAII